jgi:hypothetical protein
MALIHSCISRFGSSLDHNPSTTCQVSVYSAAAAGAAAFCAPTLVLVGVLSSIDPPTAQAGLHPEPPIFGALSEIVLPSLILPVFTSWLCPRFSFSLPEKVQLASPDAAAFPVGGAGNAMTVAAMARRASVNFMFVDRRMSVGLLDGKK